MTHILQDLRHAARRLRRSPGFTLVAVLTLAIGIGANTAIFSVVHGVLLESLPYEQPDRLVRIFNVRNGGELPVSGPNFLDYRAQERFFSGVGAYGSTTEFALTGAGEPTRLQGVRVSAELFDVLGIPLAMGRGFEPAENEPGAAPVVVLSDAAWRRDFGADRDVLGRSVTLNDEPHTVVGVAPPGVDFPGEADLWAPLVYSEAFRNDENRGAHSLNVLARLQPGVELAGAVAGMDALGERIAAEHASANGSSVAVRPMHEVVVGEIRTPLLMLLGAVGLVLLIACVNVANLLLARAAIREGEMAVRTALGAGRGRLASQLMAESVLLGLLGGAGGLVLAVWGTDLLVRLRPAGIPRLDDIGVGPEVLAFTLGVSLLTGVLFGLVPAIQLSRRSLASSIREVGRGVPGGRSSGRIRNGLIVAETALAVVLLAGAGLLVRSFIALQSVSPGFTAEGVLTVDLALPAASYPDFGAASRFYETLEERVASIPGVESVGSVSALPLSGRDAKLGVYPAEAAPPVPGEMPVMQLRLATPGYLETAGIQIVRGRGFTEADREGAPPVLLLSEEAVRRYFPGGDPVGRRLLLTWGIGPDPDDQVGGEVVGIVRDVRQSQLAAEPEPQVYVAHRQVAIGRMDLAVRTSVPPMSIAPALRQAVREVDPRLAVGEFRTLEQVVSQSISQPRFYMLLLAIFSGAALALAAVGIFGVMSYLVAQRKREIGVRMALGADPSSVLRLVVGGALALAGVGVVTGVLAAVVGTRLLSGLLFQIDHLDPLAYAGAAAVLFAVAAVASYLPARAATRVDPNIALRYD